MKRIGILAMALVLLVHPLVAFAHPGRTDSNGGHTDKSTGVYHYHHGYPEHYHTNGKCPYDYDDKTGQNSGTSSKAIKPSATTKPERTLGEKLVNGLENILCILCIIAAPFVLAFVIGFIYNIVGKIKKRR